MQAGVAVVTVLAQSEQRHVLFQIMPCGAAMHRGWGVVTESSVTEVHRKLVS